MRTTVLVGFPGETEAAFDELLAFVEDVGFDRLGVFTYSERRARPRRHGRSGAAEVMAERARLVQEAQDRIAWPRQKALYGTRQTVLVDGPSADPAFPFEGRTAGQAPEIDGVVYLRNRRLRPGRFAEVRSSRSTGTSWSERANQPVDRSRSPSRPSAGQATRRSRRARRAARWPWSAWLIPFTTLAFSSPPPS